MGPAIQPPRALAFARRRPARDYRKGGSKETVLNPETEGYAGEDEVHDPEGEDKAKTLGSRHYDVDTPDAAPRISTATYRWNHPIGCSIGCPEWRICSGSSQVTDAHWLVPRRTAPGQALEQADSINSTGDPGLFRDLDQPRADRGPGRDPVAPRQRQVCTKRSGFGRPPGVHQGTIHAGSEVRQFILARAEAEPERSRSPRRWKHAGPPELDVEPRRLGGRPLDGINRRLDAIVEGRTQKAKGQVQAVESNPANVPSTTRDAVLPDARNDPSYLLSGQRREGCRNEDATAGQVRTGPARSSARHGHAPSVPVS